MVVAKNVLENVHKRSRKQPKEEISMPKELSVEEIEKELGFDKVRPIYASPSDEKDMLEKGDCFKDWYEEELKAYYDRQKRT
jgi:hypothetical protein